MKKLGVFGSLWADATVVGTPLAVAIAPAAFAIIGNGPKNLTKAQFESHLLSVGEAVYTNASFYGAIAGLVGLFLMALAHGQWPAVDGVGKLIALWGASAAITSLILEHLNSTTALPILQVSSIVMSVCVIASFILVIAIFAVTARRARRILTNSPQRQ